MTRTADGQVNYSWAQLNEQNDQSLSAELATASYDAADCEVNAFRGGDYWDKLLISWSVITTSSPEGTQAETPGYFFSKAPYMYKYSFVLYI